MITQNTTNLPAESQAPNSDKAAILSSRPLVNITGRTGLWSELVTQNPMLDEAVREQRKFFRSAMGAGRIGPRVAIAIVGLLYLWLIVASCLTHDDVTVPYSYLELIVFTIVLPASVYGAISGERERSTWDALILTRLTSGQIITGKLIWRVRLMLILLAALIAPILISLPFVANLRDMVPASRIFGSQCAIVSWGILITGFGLWVSATTRRSIDSLAVIYTTLVAVLAVIPALYAMFANILIPGWGTGGSSNDPIMSVMMAVNPFLALATILDPGSWAPSFIPAFARTGLLISVVNVWLAAIFIFFTYRRLNWLGEPGQRARSIASAGQET
jgi:hypothetical protein